MDIKYRSASPGYLLPIIFSLSLKFRNESFLTFSRGLIIECYISSLLLLHFRSKIGKINSEYYFVWYLVPIIWIFCNGVFYNLIVYLLIISTIPTIHFNVIQRFPKSFTLGEALLFVQIFLHAFFLVVSNLSNLTFINYFDFFFLKEKRHAIFYWSICLSSSAGFVYFNYKRERQNVTRASTIARKYFHFLFFFLYIPLLTSPTSSDRQFLYIGSICLFGLFVITEVIRFNRIPIFGQAFTIHLYKALEKFRGSKDEGKLLLTPIYLLVGVTLPVWIVGIEKLSDPDFHYSIDYIGVLAGIVSICVGDTFASIGGQAIGQSINNAKLSLTLEKTYYGLICNVFSQTICFVILYLIGTFTGNLATCICLLVTILLNSIYEKVTDQNDNLIIPLLTYVIYVFLRKMVL